MEQTITEATINPQLLAFLQQQGQLVQQLLQQRTDQAPSSKTEEAETVTERPVMVQLDNYSVKDDATEHIDAFLRNKLRPINAKPEKYWKEFDRVARPVLEAYETSHLTGYLINPRVVEKMHDR